MICNELIRERGHQKTLNPHQYCRYHNGNHIIVATAQNSSLHVCAPLYDMSLHLKSFKA
jgi:hypothetical protein